MADEIKVVILMVLGVMLLIFIAPFTKDMTHMVAGALGWIGGFFKSTIAAKGSNK